MTEKNRSEISVIVQEIREQERLNRIRDAAPDLYEVLETMRTESRAAWMTMGSSLRGRAEAALAKAKGEGGKQPTKRECVLSWASGFYGQPIAPQAGWRRGWDHPGRDEVVLGFETKTRIIHLLRHKAAGIYDQLGPQDAWFDDPPERPLNIPEFDVHMWTPVPLNLIGGLDG